MTFIKQTKLLEVWAKSYKIDFNHLNLRISLYLSLSFQLSQ